MYEYNRNYNDYLRDEDVVPIIPSTEAGVIVICIYIISFIIGVITNSIIMRLLGLR
ncbi:CNPV317 hypothetical protein [Canarypox virus]|uniref:SWPV2-ORF303 n=2 Tax=Canarypox virus TaxID=44088 RepID=A0A1V0QGQ3_CNPV|nr:CNPV317 hypothetical protein [Canarypox virus]ARE67557.1 SWPV2-ORF303 [Shearwaterpox virus]QRI43034.1 hypothetical protein ChPV316 [Cheloniid poxvirus 1]QRM15596.1 hypothetical protein [Mudlarkpox virus]QRM15949.1 hypothetical protein [Penguinpox virus 2]QRM16286.1 hypothetical protein [Albatrosspox virus]